MTNLSIINLFYLETLLRSPHEFVIYCFYFNDLSFALNGCLLKVWQKY